MLGRDALTLADVIATLAAASPRATRAARLLVEELLPGRWAAGDRVVGIGWATVDTERTLADADAALDDASRLEPRVLRWSAATREPAVGATARVASVGDVSVVVLEPDTEARLAAFLARFGEGICLAYVEAEGPGGMLRPTAFGVPGRLRAHAHPWGPYLIAVSASSGPPDQEPLR